MGDGGVGESSLTSELLGVIDGVVEGASGLAKLANLSEFQRANLMHELATLVHDSQIESGVFEGPRRKVEQAGPR